MRVVIPDTPPEILETSRQIVERRNREARIAYWKERWISLAALLISFAALIVSILALFRVQNVALVVANQSAQDEPDVHTAEDYHRYQGDG